MTRKDFYCVVSIPWKGLSWIKVLASDATHALRIATRVRKVRPSSVVGIWTGHDFRHQYPRAYRYLSDYKGYR